jgi:hypothetical protein
MYHKLLKKQPKPDIKTFKEDFLSKRDPDFFPYYGTQVYTGRQGSGKTISAIKHVLDLKSRYPKAILVSNVLLNVFNARPSDVLQSTPEDFNSQRDYILFKEMEELEHVLTHVNNGTRGVIYLVDEIHTYFNALESKNIPMYIFTEIAQQRKQRKVIIGTSQLFMRLAKPFREQCDNIITCKTWLGYITLQTAYDGMDIEQDYQGKLIGNVKRKGFFIQNNKLRESYDTYQKVVSGVEQYENPKSVVKIKSKKGKFSMEM